MDIETSREMERCAMEYGAKSTGEGYYAWEKRPTREERDAPLVSALKQVKAEHPCYGVRSMVEALPEGYRLPLNKMDRAQVRSRIFDWIEGYYNWRRRHTSNEGNLPPLVKRERYNRQSRLGTHIADGASCYFFS